MQLFKGKKKGQVGFNLLTGIVVSVFVISILIMILTIFSNKMMDEVDDNDSKDIINKTKVAIGDLPNWFKMYFLMGSMIVLILMVVLIVKAIQQAQFGGGMGG